MRGVNEVDSLSYLAVKNPQIRKLRDYYNYHVNETNCHLGTMLCLNIIKSRTTKHFKATV